MSAPPSSKPVEGLRDNTPRIHALIGGRVVPRPGMVWEKAVVVIRDGVIEGAGPDVVVPADARVWDVAGKTIYPGLIDAYSVADEGEFDAEVERVTRGGAGHWNSRITPQISLANLYRPNEGRNKDFRAQGIAMRLLVPPSGIIRGTSALVTTGDGPAADVVVAQDVAQHMRLTVSGRGDGYPNSPMGAVALARQTLYDAKWYAEAWRAHRVDPLTPRPEVNDALAALATVAAGEFPAIIETSDEQYFLRADRFAREFGLNAIIAGSGHEYRRLDAVRNTGRAVIVPVHFPKAPNVATPESARDVSLEQLMHWDLAPENPGRLEKTGVRIALSTMRLDSPKEFLKGVRQSVARGLSRDGALAAMTTIPASLFGVADRVGTIDTGKGAHLVITDGDLFDEKTNVLETWVDGVRHEVTETAKFDIRGKWHLSMVNQDGSALELTLDVSGTPESPKGSLKKDETAIELKQFAVAGTRLAGTFSGDEFGHSGMARFSGLILTADPGSRSWRGSGQWGDGLTFSLAADPVGEGTESKEKEKENADKEPRKALYEPNFPLGDFGRDASPEQPDVLAFTNATVWTAGPEGILENATIIVRSGKIDAVGTHLEIPADAVVVDAQGKHISPGIIDCHSHIATDGGINESGQAITAEVRIGDFIDTNDISIYRQLAGGVTSSNILHGSANPIGGQNQVIKLRWGALPEEAKFAAAPPGIKFALGENVKQSNWGDRFTSRYPQSRMGVEQIIQDAFFAARDYEMRWRQWRDRQQGLPPRKDLELDALMEVLHADRLIHCHSYRQDEILALLRTCERFGVTIATLQHILEGYKVADVMREQGVMGSAFSDWWAYKIEVYDAIPYNGALMHFAGVNVSFNSDDAELARRLNGEAAKAVKYGGVPPEEAIRFVTLNPAMQLRIDPHVGSLEPGKDADLVVWSGSPLSSLARCEQTWIDGRKYFDRAEDQESRRKQGEMRNALIQRILAGDEELKKPGERDGTEKPEWTRIDEFCVTRRGRMDGVSGNDGGQ